ncbi:MAG: UDP-N-acetylmuramoyl-L-alanine--D-glutamate ligase [Gammaproteobacteria bacterium]|nr:UDP-N-acetylmuramoyl-L-alanine--D-glutamate ligase [Gammaproteobacteria bacterium]
METRHTHGRSVVVGMGVSGFAAARYLYDAGLDLTIMDSRDEPPNLDEIHALLPNAEVRLGGFDAQVLADAVQLVMSPGVSLQTTEIASALEAGVPVLGEIELFARAVRQPVIAITGSNGKSTVTAMLGEMIARSGREVAVGGNLGTPALELLASSSEAATFVLELSSFQLETLRSLRPIAAALLNVAPDHLDRYDSFEAYRDAKARITLGAEVVVINGDDPWLCELVADRKHIRFTAKEPSEGEFGLRDRDGELWLCFGDDWLMAQSDVRLAGLHNTMNVLAAFALGSAAGIAFAPMCEVAREFAGLAHRCELIAEHDGVRWINDSKGTNVGATVAAIDGLASLGPITLIAGGLIKEPNLQPLREAAIGTVAQVILIGRDAPVLAELFDDVATQSRAASMKEAVSCAARVTSSGGTVLLSPAAASFDMFDSYAARGESFAREVKEQVLS